MGVTLMNNLRTEIVTSRAKVQVRSSPFILSQEQFTSDEYLEDYQLLYNVQRHKCEYLSSLQLFLFLLLAESIS